MSNSPELTQVMMDYEFLCVETVDGFRYFMFGDAFFDDNYTSVTVWHLFGHTKFERARGDMLRWREVYDSQTGYPKR